MQFSISRWLPVLAFSLMVPALRAETAEASGKVDEARQLVRIELGGSLFTQWIYGGLSRPVLYPVMGPGKEMMVRHWPLEEATPGEEKDHPHHKGLWFAHGEVNGIDFWSEKPEAGKIVVKGVPEVSSAGGTVTVKSNEEWRKPDESVVMTSATTITCGMDGKDKYIDYSVTMTASAGDVLFGDTKEGTMAIRVNPLLNLKGEVAKGQALTSEGKTGDAAWGTHATWVDYWAPMTPGILGVACFEHPSNLRAPTTWHARDYGLIAANPFGLHDFEKKPKGTGNYTLEKGKSLTLKYRWLFHEGSPVDAKIEERWTAWASHP